MISRLAIKVGGELDGGKCDEFSNEWNAFGVINRGA